MPINSSYTVQSLIDDVSANGDVAPALATGGWSDQPILHICDDVMRRMMAGGPNGQPFNWKWNRTNVPPFFTISWQQDYFIPGLVNLFYLEIGWAIEYNLTSQPKPKIPVEVKRDLQVTYQQANWPWKACWIPAKLAQVGTWGANEVTTPTGQNNPGPGVVYTNPQGANMQPTNPITCIADPNGNLWVVTTYGTCGNTQPSWPSTPVYPTLQNPSTVATTVTDGSVVWTAINPNGQAIRLSPIPPQAGPPFQINLVGQMRPQKFTSLTQTLDPLPDDYYPYFKDGVFAECYRRHPDPKVRAKYPQELQLWMKSLDLAVKAGDSELSDFGFYPGGSVMETGWGAGWWGPAYPFAGWPGW
jgi:hypothetical protein